MGLDDEVFWITSSNILSTEPLLTLNSLYTMILQEERHQNLVRAKEDRSAVVAFVVHSSSTAHNDYSGIPSNYSDKPPSAKCGKFNHERKKCFWLSDKLNGGVPEEKEERIMDFVVVDDLETLVILDAVALDMESTVVNVAQATGSNSKTKEDVTAWMRLSND
ncbi:hypothetical protein RDI58_029058 [Solanum bulbocastanum]|uniref:Uncharacterized protein n=1 Tax=Solanum bulbocastanum TaxID=147425 RepID=A0AAN8SPQ6_SOLBU